jgi:hypothetical protein
VEDDLALSCDRKLTGEGLAKVSNTLGRGERFVARTDLDAVGFHEGPGWHVDRSVETRNEASKE